MNYKTPKKSLGQNFLTNTSIARNMIIAGEVTASDIIVEIGPGCGILTAELLHTGARIIAIEKDSDLVTKLQKEFAKEIQVGQLTLIHDDILKFNPANYPLQATNYKVVANIPYYITGEILRHSLTLVHQPSLMALMVQKEVAERIVARNEKESILSLSVKCYGEPQYTQTVKSGNFSPAPKVDSAIILIKNISRNMFQKSKIDEKAFFTLIKTGFAQKRKKLLSNLAVLYKKETLLQAFQTCNIPENTRAEDLGLSQWRCIYTRKNIR